MIALLIAALALYAIRGLAEYLVSADLFGGWRLPAWYSHARNTGPGWWPIRDHWHLAQFVRNRAANLAPFLVSLTILLTSAKWYHAVILYAASEVLWVIGHGATFSALAKWYAKR